MFLMELVVTVITLAPVVMVLLGVAVVVAATAQLRCPEALADLAAEAVPLPVVEAEVVHLAILVVPRFSAVGAVQARVPTRKAPVEMVVLEPVVVVQLC